MEWEEGLAALPHDWRQQEVRETMQELGVERRRQMRSVLRQWSVWMRKRGEKKIKMKDKGRLGERARKGRGWGGACLPIYQITNLRCGQGKLGST